MSARVRREQRPTSEHPCPVCGGWPSRRRGHHGRCHGFVSTDGRWAHCSREERAGSLVASRHGLFVHFLGGSCRCGLDHRRGDAPARPVAQLAQLAQADMAITRIWQETVTAAGSLVEPYLASRGLSGPIPPTLRFSPALVHRPSHTAMPAMVAAIGRWPECRLIALHRTYLAPTGSTKADVDPNRMMLGPVAGGAVWLAPPAERIALVEGIETGLAVQSATGIATWAALSASNLPNVVLPPLPLAAEVVIAADHDAAGLRAAYRAAERLSHEGRRVRVAVPDHGDFNDLLQGVAS